MTNPFISLEKAAAHMHQGAGPESLQQAAGAWGVVAQKLATAAEEMLLMITWRGGQYWQSPAAQQIHDAVNSIAQGLKNNAVVARQIETAATWVAAAFNKAQAATATPQQVANNHERRAWLISMDSGLGYRKPEIAACDADYQTMWLHSITAHAIYYHDTSHALVWGEQTWWTPHQQPADTPTTAGDHPPTHDVPDIPSQITQHRDTTAALCRIYALDHAIHIIEHQKEYKKQSTYAQMCENLADHGNATAELHNKMAQHHKEAAQLHQDLPRGLADIPTLAHKYVEIATTWHQTKQHMQETLKAYYAASTTQPHLQKMRDNLSNRKDYLTDSMGSLFIRHNLDLENPDLHSYTNSLQWFSEQITHNSYATREAGLHQVRVNKYAAFAADIQGCAHDRAEEAGNAWRAARQCAQPITDRVRDCVVLLQAAARADDQATTLADSSA